MTGGAGIERHSKKLFLQPFFIAAVLFAALLYPAFAQDSDGPDNQEELTVEQKAIRWARPELSLSNIRELIEEIELNASKFGVDSSFAVALIAAEASVFPEQAFGRQWSNYMQLRKMHSYDRVDIEPVWLDSPNAISTIRFAIDQVKTSGKYADRTLKSALEIYWMGPDRSANTSSFDRFYLVFKEKYKAIAADSHSSSEGMPIIPDELSQFQSKLPRMSELDSKLKAWPMEDAYVKAILKFNNKLSDKTALLIARAVLSFSHDAGVDPRLVMALIAVESNFKVGATSPKGAMGLGQLMPATAKSFGIRDPYEPVQNIWVCVRYLEREFYRYRNRSNSLDLVLAAYNAGPGAVAKYGGVPPYKETVRYVSKVKSLYKSLSG
ncbi:MAG: lytic transglycosylase domain-containing protein [bacterium]